MASSPIVMWWVSYDPISMEFPYIFSLYIFFHSHILQREFSAKKNTGIDEPWALRHRDFVQAEAGSGPLPTLRAIRDGSIPSGKLTWLWKITIFNGKIHYKWPFSIATLNYQRVYIYIYSMAFQKLAGLGSQNFFKHHYLTDFNRLLMFETY